jgi:hypothetical protein
VNFTTDDLIAVTEMMWFQRNAEPASQGQMKLARRFSAGEVKRLENKSRRDD